MVIKKFKSEWYFTDKKPVQGGQTNHPEPQPVLTRLDTLLDREGELTITSHCAEGETLKSLSFRCQDGFALVRLYHRDSDDDYVASLHPDVGAWPIEEKQIDIFGDLWDGSDVTKDKDLIRTIVNEFLATGNVSERYLE